MIHNCERFELVFVKVMCKIRYRRIARLLKQVSSIQFVKLNTSLSYYYYSTPHSPDSMVDNRFGGVALKLSRIGSVDTRIELEMQARSNKNLSIGCTCS